MWDCIHLLIYMQITITVRSLMGKDNGWRKRDCLTILLLSFNFVTHTKRTLKELWSNPLITGMSSDSIIDLPTAFSNAEKKTIQII